jgi:hypothetical protein
MLCQKTCDVPFGMTAMLSADDDPLFPEQPAIASVTSIKARRDSVEFMLISI